ncbi:unnamed protein product [Danaus chrysippus]|uniref:(African queen) hypothetical protein n=1 Tax=Danaus chrysippus TaxID=151541 RepID=A0A8J2QKT4_9NEOP|nr:unnamed protein product [Danaus chrysippus]
MRKETVIHHQNIEESKKGPEKKTLNKIETIIQNLDPHRDMTNTMKKKPDPPKDTFNEMDSRKLQMPVTSKESEISFRNDMLHVRKDEIVVSRSIIEKHDEQLPKLSEQLDDHTADKLSSTAAFIYES